MAVFAWDIEIVAGRIGWVLVVSVLLRGDKRAASKVLEWSSEEVVSENPSGMGNAKSCKLYRCRHGHLHSPFKQCPKVEHVESLDDHHW